jgi:NADPH:quinone reductase-like Zn-dependent oxidoreductase
MPWAALTGSQRVFAGPAAEKPADLLVLKELAESGAFKPLIDRVFPFSRIVDAHAYVDTGRKKGSVVVTVD